MYYRRGLDYVLPFTEDWIMYCLSYAYGWVNSLPALRPERPRRARAGVEHRDLTFTRVRLDRQYV
jgi:hypothetical protein